MCTEECVWFSNDLCSFAGECFYRSYSWECVATPEDIGTPDYSGRFKGRKLY